MPGNVLSLPGSSIELSEGEVLVRQYHITVNQKPKARGDVAITNKRIIYQGKGKTSVTIKEVPIESVSAINTFYGKGLKAGMILLGVIFIIVGIAGIATVFLPILGLILGIFCFLNAFNSGYSLSIKSSAVAGTGISVGASDISLSNGGFFSRLFSTSGQGASFSMNAAPTAEALVMMNELGAIVLDLKTMGDKAIPKWKNYKAQPVDTSVLTAKLSSAIPDFNAIKESIPNITITPKQPAQPSPGVSAQQYPGSVQTQPPGSAPQQYASAQNRQAPPPPPPPAMASAKPAPQNSQSDESFFS